MTIVINWRYSTETLDIDIDNLDDLRDRVCGLKMTSEWWPKGSGFFEGEEAGKSVGWQVKCRVQVNDTGDVYRIRVKYRKDKQKDPGILQYFKKHGYEDCCGKSTIIVKRDPETGLAESKGCCKWKPEDRDARKNGAVGVTGQAIARELGVLEKNMNEEQDSERRFSQKTERV